MRKIPNVYQLDDLQKMNMNNHPHALIDDRWVLARPLGWMGILGRIRTAWLVFTGRADAVVWPGGQ